MPSGRERGGHGGWIGGLKEASGLLGLGGSTEICMGHFSMRGWGRSCIRAEVAHKYCINTSLYADIHLNLIRTYQTYI